MKKVLLFVFLMILGSGLFGCTWIKPITNGYPIQYDMEGAETDLLVIRDSSHHYGYMDTSGKVIIKPKYEDARFFHEGLAAVREGKKYGYIDKNGKTVIPFQYYDAMDFHNGKAFAGIDPKMHVEIYELKCVLIDTTGTPIHDAEFGSVCDFSEGMILAYNKNDCYLYDTVDDETRKIPYVIIRDFFRISDGLFPIEDNDGDYYLDVGGNKAIQDTYANASPFSEGLAPVMPKASGELWGYIDKTGKPAIEPKFRSAFGFGENIACAQDTTGDWMLIDKNGNKVCSIQSPIGKAKPFREGLCAVGILREDTKGYINDQKYKWGFIDTSGKVVIDSKYDLVSSFVNGIAEVIIDGKIGYIDKTGKYLWDPK